MKQYTDFNDLATKSVLGSEGVKRQVRPVVESLIERRQALNLQDKECVQPLAKHCGYFENNMLGVHLTGIRIETFSPSSSREVSFKFFSPLLATKPLCF